MKGAVKQAMRKRIPGIIAARGSIAASAAAAHAATTKA